MEIGGGTSFVLTNISSERGKHDTKASPAAASYALKERQGLDLGPYIQQKVELTGVVVPAATSGDKDDNARWPDSGGTQGPTPTVAPVFALLEAPLGG